MQQTVSTKVPRAATSHPHACSVVQWVLQHPLRGQAEARVGCDPCCSDLFLAPFAFLTSFLSTPLPPHTVGHPCLRLRAQNLALGPALSYLCLWGLSVLSGGAPGSLVMG